MRDIRTLSRESDPFFARVAGMIRRMQISVTGGVATARALWQLVGFKMPDNAPETFNAEHFSGIGFFARPPASGSQEAIVLMVGDAKTPVIVATRDEKTRAAIVGALKANESAMFNNASLVHVKDDSTIEARSKNGVAVELAKASELQALATAFYAHIHAASGAPTTKPIAEFSLPDPPGAPLVNPGQPGTTKLKGE